MLANSSIRLRKYLPADLAVVSMIGIDSRIALQKAEVTRCGRPA